MNEYFDFNLEPGKLLIKEKYNYKEPEISVIVPFYNDVEYIEQTVNSILNQTYPYFELLIIDDGSKDKKSLDKLEEIKSLDERIKIFHKQNEGLAATRDYGAAKASKKTKYLMFIDSDDLIEKTFLECGYWTLETNKDASWTYSDSIGFDKLTYTWNKWFDSDKMKKVNDLISAAMIRKEDFFEVNGYELKEKKVNEDWNLWLKLIAKGKYPVHMSYYGQWYRRKDSGELVKSKENKKRALEIINNTSKTIKNRVEAIQYPRFDYNYDKIIKDFESIVIPEKNKDEKINLLMIIPWMITGGADKFNLELIKRLDKEKYNVTVITTEININTLRQQFEKYSTVYDLTSFLNQKYWYAFVSYIIQKNNINLIINSNSEVGYSFLPLIKANYSNIPIIDYVHMEEWYNRNGGYSRDSSAVCSVIDKTLTCNKNSRKVLLEKYKRKPDEVETVYIGVDEKEFDPEKYNKDEIKEKYNVPKDKKIIGYICRITEQKRPFLLLEIIKKLHNNDYLFIVAGDGNLLNDMKNKSDAMGISDDIMFLGNIDKIQEIYSMCDITINCSIKEGLSISSYESLAMDVPVISSDVGGQKELINNEVGIIVSCLQDEKEINNYNYKDEEIENYVLAIKDMISNLSKYKGKCRDRVSKNFSLDNMIKNISSIFEKVVEEPSVEKIDNGKELLKQENVCMELITKTFLELKNNYIWKVNNYRNYYSYGENYRLALYKEKMWNFAPYRFIISVLHKLKKSINL